MYLHIIRHAKASHDDHFPGDFYRTLTKAGYEEAATAASVFSAGKHLPELIISSPAVRAYTTALIFAAKLNYPADRIQLHSSIYEAPYTKLLRVIREIKNETSIALFGHNPGLTDLLHSLTGNHGADLHTAGVASLKMKIQNWSEADANCGELVDLRNR